MHLGRVDTKAVQDGIQPRRQISLPGIEILQPGLETGFVLVALRGTFLGSGASGCHIRCPSCRWCQAYRNRWPKSKTGDLSVRLTTPVADAMT
jgi:hypothetical protein